MWLDRVVQWLLPKEDHFFDLLERGAECVHRCSKLLVDCCEGPTYERRTEIVEQMRDVEHEADKVIVEVYEALNKTFVTPLDRSDIYALATDLERITDEVFAIALQVVLHALEVLPAGSQDLAELIHKGCGEILQAVSLLRNTNELNQIRSCCKRINQIEHDGDQIYRLRIAELFRHESDAIALIKHKEFLEGLERTLDTCDDMANALETIVIKNS
jgi:predicted phosphate transport protein (TIGR00153 family)